MKPLSKDMVEKFKNGLACTRVCLPALGVHVVDGADINLCRQFC